MATTLRRKKTSRYWKPATLKTRDRALFVLCRDFTRTGRVLSGDFRLIAKTTPSGSFPAWSLGPEIWVNKQTATPMVTYEDYGVMQGLCEHEMAHVMFTPTVAQMQAAVKLRQWNATSLLAEKLQAQNDPTFTHAWNILEDARIETMLVAEYPTMREYLTLAFLHYCVGDGSHMDEVFLFARGRRYLSRRLRARARRKFKSQKHVAEISRLIDEYRVLNMRSGPDIESAFHYVNRLALILKEIDPPGNSNHMCNGVQVALQRGLNTDPKGGGGADAKTQDAILVKVHEEDQQAGSGTPDDEKNDEPAQTGAPGAAGSDDKKGKDDGKSKSDKPGHGVGGGDDDDDSKSDEAIVAEERAIVADSQRVRQDMRGLKRIVMSSDPLDPDTMRQAQWEDRAPQHLPPIVRKVMKELRRIEEDADPHWLTHTTSGRLNMGRAMRTEDPFADDLYDEWREGQLTAADMELVVLLDVSPSMQGHDEILSHAAWVIKRACDTLRVACTEMIYSGHHAIVYGPKDKATQKWPRLRPGGATTAPGSALVESHRVLATSKKRHRALVILTDGSWDSSVPHAVKGDFEVCEDIIDDLNRRGVMTAVAFLETSDSQYVSQEGRRHRCQALRNITRVDDFPLFVRDQLVTELHRRV